MAYSIHQLFACLKAGRWNLSVDSVGNVMLSRPGPGGPTAANGPEGLESQMEYIAGSTGLNLASLAQAGDDLQRHSDAAEAALESTGWLWRSIDPDPLVVIPKALQAFDASFKMRQLHAPKAETEAPAPTAPQVLENAAKHIGGRADTYDQPQGERSMARTVEVFNAMHGTNLTPAQGWHFLQTLKDVRLFTRAKYHADSAEDCVAYAALKAEAKATEVPCCNGGTQNPGRCAGCAEGGANG